MKDFILNGEKKQVLVVIPKHLYKQKMTAKSVSDKLGMEGPAEVQQSAGKARKGAFPQAVNWYDSPVGVVSAEMFWKAGVDLCDETGKIITKGTEDVYVYTTSDGRYDSFYSGQELRNVIDLSDQIADVPTWCATVYEASKGRMNETQKFFLTACMYDDKAMQKVLWWKALIGCSLKAAMDYTGYKKPTVTRKNKKGVVKVSTRGLKKAMEESPDQVTPASVDERLATDNFAEHVMSKLSDKVTLRHLTRKAVIAEMKKEYLKGLQTDQKGGEAVGGEPVEDGGQP